MYYLRLSTKTSAYERYEHSVPFTENDKKFVPNWFLFIFELLVLLLLKICLLLSRFFTIFCKQLLWAYFTIINLGGAR